MSVAVLSIADLNTEVNHEPRISHVRLAEVLGYSSQHKLGHLIDRHKEALRRFGPIPSTVDGNRIGRGRRTKIRWLSKLQALYITTKAETEFATEATIQMVEVFDAFLAGRLQSVEPPADFTHKTVAVKAHTRRIHRLDPRQLQLPAPLNRDGLGVLMVDGKAVMFDASNKGGPGDLVVYWYSGRVSVGVRHENAQYDGRALIPYVDGLPSWAINGRLDAPVIGRVVERRAV